EVGSLAVLFAVLISPPPETDAEFVKFEGASLATVTVRVIAGKFEPAANASFRVHDRDRSTQFHPAPSSAVAVRAAGRVSVTVTVPLVESPPMLETVSVYAAPICPCVKEPVWVLVILKSGTAVIEVGSLAVLFAVLISPPTDTAAEFLTLEGALPATVTVRVIAGKFELAAKTSLRVQVRDASVQFHPVPVKAVAVRPVGSVSVTVTVPLV